MSSVSSTPTHFTPSSVISENRSETSSPIAFFHHSSNEQGLDWIFSTQQNHLSRPVSEGAIFKSSTLSGRICLLELELEELKAKIQFWKIVCPKLNIEASVAPEKGTESSYSFSIQERENILSVEVKRLRTKAQEIEKSAKLFLFQQDEENGGDSSLGSIISDSRGFVAEGLFDKAIEAFNFLVSQRPNEIDFRYKRLDLINKVSKKSYPIESRIIDLSMVILWSNEWSWRLIRAELYANQHKLDLAKLDLSKCPDKESENPKIKNIADFLKDFEKIDLIKRQISSFKLDNMNGPLYIILHIEVVEILIKWRKFSEAMSMLQTLESRFPNDPTVQKAKSKMQQLEIGREEEGKQQ